MIHVVDKLSYETIKVPSQVWGGLSGIKGKRIFIKPNLVNPITNYNPWSTTRVEVIEFIIEKLLSYDPKEIIVGECGFKDQWEATIQSTDYDELPEKYPIVKLIPLQDGANFHKFTLKRIPDYRSLFGVKFSDYLLESDVIINVPKLKVHNMALVTGAIKNMMGTMAQKGSMHPKGNDLILHKRLADLYLVTNEMVDFVVMDGIVGCEYSEQSGVPVNSGVLIFGTDQWEVDVAAAKLMGINPEDVKYLKYIRNDFESIKVKSSLIKNYEKPLKYRL